MELEKNCKKKDDRLQMRQGNEKKTKGVRAFQAREALSSPDS